MPLRFIDVPSLGRRLTNIMAAPSSADPDTHSAGLDAYRRLGGNCIHLHGEGGEIHSRSVTGEWLKRHGFRSEFFLCVQICHDAWDEVDSVAISRFDAQSVREDIANDLNLMGIDCLDLVYLDDAPGQPFEPIVDAMGEEVRQGRIRAYGVRNWSPERIRAANAYAVGSGRPGISAVFTTEMSLLHAQGPLWPGYVPFSVEMRQVVMELGLAVFAHMNSMTTGDFLFDASDASPMSGPSSIRRWQMPFNQEIVRRTRSLAALRNAGPQELAAGYLLNEPFPVVGIVGLPEILSSRQAEFEAASNLVLSEEDRRFLGKS